MAEKMTPKNRIWFCKIGETSAELPRGSDGPMRTAIAAAYRQITGEEPAFIFSGWGGELTEGERWAADDVSAQEVLAILRFREAAAPFTTSLTDTQSVSPAPNEDKSNV